MDWDILLPLGVCVVLPVMIVWLITRARQNETNKKTEINSKLISAFQFAFTQSNNKQTSMLSQYSIPKHHQR